MTTYKFLEKPAEQITLVYLFATLLSVLSIYVLADGVLKEREDRRDVAFRQVGAMADLAADDIARSLNGVRDSLRLFSRLPEFRTSKPLGLLAPWMQGLIFRINDALSLLEQSVEETRQVGRKFRDDVSSYADSLLAGKRLLAELPLFLTRSSREEGISVEPPPLAAPLELVDDAAPGLWLLQLVRAVFLPGLGPLQAAGAQVDSLFAFGSLAPSNLKAVENLLRAGQSDRDLIRSISVKQMDGTELVGITEIGEPLGVLSGWVRQAARAARPFYAGPVWYDEGLGRPLWNAAVPLRDELREPFAVLSSQVDLAFLGNLVQKIRLTSASHLMVVDEEGIVIAHPKASLIANQVNLSHANVAVAEVISGQDGIREFKIGDSLCIVAFRALRNLDPGVLPGWGVLYLTPSADLMGSFFWSVTYAFFMGLTALFVIFRFSGMIIEGLEDPEE